MAPDAVVRFCGWFHLELHAMRTTGYFPEDPGVRASKQRTTQTHLSTRTTLRRRSTILFLDPRRAGDRRTIGG